MKRKLFTAFAIILGLAFTSCSEDAAMEELIQDSELSTSDPINGDGDDDDKNDPVSGG